MEIVELKENAKKKLGITKEYKAFYLGTAIFRDEILHLVSDSKDKINALGTVCVTDEDFKKYYRILKDKEFNNEESK